MTRSVAGVPGVMQGDRARSHQGKSFNYLQCGVLSLLVLAVVAGGRPEAQSGSDLEFEVASIRRHQGNEFFQLQILPGGRLRTVNSSPDLLIENAFELPSSRIVGGPEWSSRIGFDILATAPDAPAPYGRQAIMGMLRTLLRDRFALKTHSEMRTTSIYTLVLSRADRAFGATMRPSTTDCAQYFEKLAKARAAPTTPPQGPHCGLRIEVRGGASRFSYGARTMTEIAAALTQYADRPVVDGTMLFGRFDLDLAFTPDNAPVFPGRQSEGRQSLATALAQAGLKLEPKQGEVEMLVIDDIQMPSEN